MSKTAKFRNISNTMQRIYIFSGTRRTYIVGQRTVETRKTTNHNLALTWSSARSPVEMPSTISSTVRMTHSVPSSLDSHLSSALWFLASRALRRPKVWLTSCGPTPPSARREAMPTTDPNARLRFPWSGSPKLLVSPKDLVSPGRGESTVP